MKKKNRSALMWINGVAGKAKIQIIILLLVQSVMGICDVASAMFLRNLVNKAVDKEQDGFIVAVAAFVGLIIVRIALRAVYRFLEEFMRSAAENRLKGRLFEALLHKDYASVSRVNSGEWMNRLTSDTVVVADGMAQILPGVAGMAVKMAGALAAILYMEPEFIFILAPGGALLIFFTYSFRKILKKLHKRIQESDGRLRVFFQERLGAMMIVRAYAQEDRTAEQAGELMKTHRAAKMKRNHFSNICNIGFASAMNGAYVLGAAFCGYGILNGTMSYGNLMAVLQLIGQIQNPFANITGYLPKYYAMLASAERLMEAERLADSKYMEMTEPEGTSEQERTAEPEGTAESEKTAEPEDGMDIHELPCGTPEQEFYRKSFRGICMEDVSFTYQPPVSDGTVISDISSVSDASQTSNTPEALDAPQTSNEPQMMPVVLSGMGLEIRKGEYVAFTGHSGCGKSTVLKLLMCLYPPDSGGLYLLSDEGKRPLTSHWRRLFAYVPQGNQIMSGTIREIITFGDPQGMREEERLGRALQIACADGFVAELEQGIDTLLGERGAGLSEGQMQRIAIARAVFSDHPILLLDEATSALDEAVEMKLLANLKAMTDKTVIIVTHRMAALSICDKEIKFE